MFHYVKSPGREAAMGLGLPEVRPTAPKGFYATYLKRFFDIAFILGTAPFVLPIVGFFAFLVKLDGGPAFYGQPRIGRDGRRFTCWKLRSMVVNADKSGVDSTSANDQRITAVGHFIRRFKLTTK